MTLRRPLTLVTLTFSALVVFFILWSVLPVISDKKPVASTKVLARDGSLLYEVSRPDEGLRTPVTLDRVPSSLVQAVIAAEDARFRLHSGVDWFATLRAAKDAIMRGRAAGGASTIEQQLIKNLYFPSAKRTVLQKLREMSAAAYWNLGHSKDETLEVYLNTVPFGNQANGAQAAARTYFRKDVADLTLAESAMLAGIIAAPSAYDPYGHYDAASKRRGWVLGRMTEQGMIEAKDRDEVVNTEVTVFQPRHDIKAPHFVFRVLDELEPRFPDIITGGYTIKTTLDPELQTVVEDAVARRLATLAGQRVSNAAAVAIDPASGGVLVYVGSADYFDAAIGGAVDMARAKRQPGSALKPFMYFTAFMRGWTPGSVVADLPVRFTTADGKSYYPRNYSHKYFGPVTLRDALASSLNIPAVKVLNELGLPAFFSSLARFGLAFPEAPDHYGLGVVLGGGEVSLTDTVRAYGSLARYGKSVPLRDVLEVSDMSGRAVFSTGASRDERLFEDSERAEQAAYLVADVLSDKLARSRSFGEANLLDTGKNLAVKTGTTRDFRDNWAFGYAPDFALGVWVGNADNSPMQGVSGITGAVPILRDIVMSRYRNRDAVSWPVPRGIVEREICVTSGKLANGICPKTRLEKFISDTEPTALDDWYVRLDVDGASGRLATDACRENVVTKIFLKPPAEYAAWFAAAKHEAPPAYDCEGRPVAGANAELTIISPLDGDAFERDDIVDHSAVRVPFIAGGTALESGRAGGADTRVFRWNLNGQIIESSDSVYLWNPKPGDYDLGLEGSNRHVRFTVR